MTLILGDWLVSSAAEPPRAGALRPRHGLGDGTLREAHVESHVVFDFDWRWAKRLIDPGLNASEDWRGGRDRLKG